jgi:hypothetical protein
MLDPALEAAIRQEVQAGRIQASPPDDASFPFWRLLVGVGPSGSEEERMFETEAAQLVFGSRNAELVAAFQAHAAGAALAPATIARARQLLKAEPDISATLAARL